MQSNKSTLPNAFVGLLTVDFKAAIRAMARDPQTRLKR